MLTNTLRTSASSVSRRAFHVSRLVTAKGDTSTIDSYKLPSQTSIHEWEFKYDFIPKTTEPKVPPVTKEAVKQDIAHEKAKQVAHEMFAKESNSSVKVEANDAHVVHGGESVTSEPEFLHDRGSIPVDLSRPGATQPKKPANRDQYVQSSINPNINNSDVVNLGDRTVDHKQTTVDKQTPVVDDLDHDNLHHQETHEQPKSGPGLGVPLLVLGLGGAGYYYYSKEEKK
ncbi:uncharacterized protein CANTADRAFT_44896 [Suhomyces tanzawaensis NRRL Y-17324]|uniref:Uncharacterized protein n=1 Tax=Suhomyces tanzawaensis NRRL Y-17324 TaxID=984487 RepID=A0A1E4SQM5_9ASCO|nr:uncharacterized protein CANTADRAFT_44896 [Suhomyces tanzawaensis NRRL Y-17324]ODV81801.1 hypothetical protein CANTADRAFT_44896 [Suhomyces tanzawaensis NRRL Y-17324]